MVGYVLHPDVVRAAVGHLHLGGEAAAARQDEDTEEEEERCDERHPEMKIRSVDSYEDVVVAAVVDLCLLLLLSMMMAMLFSYVYLISKCANRCFSLSREPQFG